MPIQSLKEARSLGLIDARAETDLAPICSQFSMLVSDHWAKMMDPHDPKDPLRLQMMPDLREMENLPGDSKDPIGDRAHEPVPRLIHRYPDRALLLVTDRCPSLCRFCFRKQSPLHGEEPPFDLEAISAYIAAHREIREVILSGGDPLMLKNSQIDAIFSHLEGLGHVERFRIHTRMPITLPERVDEGFCSLIRRKKPVYIALHIDHPKELSPETLRAIDDLARAGAVLVSQTVLLKGVNADLETLTALCHRLAALRVRPYYLHHPDRALGTAHFRVSIAQGLRLYRALRRRVTPLELPIYVLDLPGGYGKVPLDTPAVCEQSPGHWRLESPLGGVFDYVDPVWEG